MKLAIRGICMLALALTVVGLVILLLAPSGAAGAAWLALAGGLINLGGKFALVAALVAALVCVRLTQWGWLAGLLVVAALTLFSGPLSALLGGSAAPYITAPLVAAALTLAYTTRMGDLASMKG